MPAKISQKDVIRQLYEEYVIGTLRVDLSDCGESLPITYKTFALVMMVDDFISSAPTIKAKWNGLTASGIITPAYKGDKAVIDTDALASAVGIKKQKNKKTNTSTASTAEVVE